MGVGLGRDPVQATVKATDRRTGVTLRGCSRRKGCFSLGQVVQTGGHGFRKLVGHFAGPFPGTSQIERGAVGAVSAGGYDCCRLFHEGDFNSIDLSDFQLEFHPGGVVENAVGVFDGAFIYLDGIEVFAFGSGGCPVCAQGTILLCHDFPLDLELHLAAGAGWKGRGAVQSARCAQQYGADDKGCSPDGSHGIEELVLIPNISYFGWIFSKTTINFTHIG